MAPNNGYVMPTEFNEEPVSRTYQYRKVMKPMLERKRRARINRCLDELKELMVGALQSDGENVSKLEKADILELTVRHLHGLKRNNQLIAKPETSYADRFRAGFTHCAAEVSQFLATTTTPEGIRVDQQSGVKLMQHLGGCMRRLEVTVQQTTPINYIQQTIPQQINVQQQVHQHQHQHQQYAVQHMYTPPSSPVNSIISTESASAAPMWRPW